MGTKSNQKNSKSSSTGIDEGHTVLLIHGIRTQAEWHQRISHLLEQEANIRVVPTRYEYLDIVRFILPFAFLRNKSIDRITRLMRDELSNKATKRISIVAHSFGTYIISKILQRESDIEIHRLIFCGSIVPDNYPWELYKHRLAPGEAAQWQVVNDCGIRDIWPVLAKSITWGFGSSGCFGFGHNRVKDRFHDVGHGGFFSIDFVEEYWLPFLVRGQVVDGVSERPTSSWWLSLLTVLQLKYIIVLLLLGFGYKAINYGVYIWPEHEEQDVDLPSTLSIENPELIEASSAAFVPELEEFVGDYPGTLTLTNISDVFVRDDGSFVIAAVFVQSEALGWDLEPIIYSFDSNGNNRWSSVLNFHSSSDHILRIIPMRGKNFILLGEVNQDEIPSPSWISIYDENGKPLEYKRFDKDHITVLNRYSDEEYLAAGTTAGIKGGWIAMLNSSLELEKIHDLENEPVLEALGKSLSDLVVSTKILDTVELQRHYVTLEKSSVTNNWSDAKLPNDETYIRFIDKISKNTRVLPFANLSDSYLFSAEALNDVDANITMLAQDVSVIISSVQHKWGIDREVNVELVSISDDFNRNWKKTLELEGDFAGPFGDSNKIAFFKYDHSSGTMMKLLVDGRTGETSTEKITLFEKLPEGTQIKHIEGDEEYLNVGWYSTAMALDNNNNFHTFFVTRNGSESGTSIRVYRKLETIK